MRYVMPDSRDSREPIRFRDRQPLERRTQEMRLLPHLHQPITHRPARPHLPKRPINLILGYFRIRPQISKNAASRLAASSSCRSRMILATRSEERPPA